MTIADDTEWLRTQLVSESFHSAHSQKWVAVLDGRVIYSTPNRDEMQSWLDANDGTRRCILAFGDERIIV